MIRALAILGVTLTGCAEMPAPCPEQAVTSIICPQLKEHDAVDDAEAAEEADNLPSGSAIYEEYVELKSLRRTLAEKCGTA